jgi:hypothetical protein
MDKLLSPEAVPLLGRVGQNNRSAFGLHADHSALTARGKQLEYEEQISLPIYPSEKLSPIKLLVSSLWVDPLEGHAQKN